MEKDFIIYAAPVDDVDAGWIWFKSNLPTRTVIKVRNKRTRRHVYCLSRQIDDNFIARYNNQPADERPRRYKITGTDLDNALVISEWYRNALGGFPSTYSKNGTSIRLSIVPDKPLKWWSAPVLWWWGLRAACHNPDIVARVGTRLGILGAWLGVIGLVPPVFISHGVKADEPAVGWTQIVVAVIGGIVGWLACRGVKPPSCGTEPRSSM